MVATIDPSGSSDREAGRYSSPALFRLFLEAAPDAVVIIEPDGRIALVNAQTESLFGYPRTDLVGRHVEMLLPERFRAAHRAHRDRYIDEPRTRPMGAGLDLFGLRADGSEFPVDISLAPLQTDEGFLLAAAIRDVTERKKLEALRDEFIANAAHELRTPIAALTGLGGTLARHLHSMTPEQVSQALEALERQGHRASELVKNLLDLSQLEGGRGDIRIGVVDLASVVQLAMEAAPAPDATVVTDRVPQDLAVAADDVRLQQIIVNLLTNAYRYGGQTVTLDARVDGGVVVFACSDDGDGIPEGLRETLFDPFTRGRTAGEHGGSGIGLALCRRLAESMGGSIAYESVDPHGVRFVVRLRAAS